MVRIAIKTERWNRYKKGWEWSYLGSVFYLPPPEYLAAVLPALYRDLLD
jgi:hypothetical protein